MNLYHFENLSTNKCYYLVNKQIMTNKINESSKSVVIALSASKKSGTAAAEMSKASLLDVDTVRFQDGEMTIKIKETVRNKRVFIIQSTSNPAAEHLMELLITIDALKRASASEINVIMPYYGYARQDRKNKGRQPITAKLVADMLETAGASRIITFDLHADQIQGFFNIPVDNLKGTLIMAKKISKMNIENLTVVSPDNGGIIRARLAAEVLGNVPLAVIDKRRTGTNQATAQYVLGDVKDRNVLLIDDIVDTAGTISSAIKLLKENGALDVYVAATHAVLSGTQDDPNRAIKRMVDAGIKQFFTTNTVDLKDNINFKEVTVFNIDEVLAEVIDRNISHESISDYFKKE
jgi:ribose-phosphate pyrophosphokinase